MVEFGKIKKITPRFIKKAIKKFLSPRLLYPHFVEAQASYRDKVQRIATLIDKGRLKVAFIVLFDTTFPGKPLFELMLKDSAFDPYIIVVPNIAVSKEFASRVFNETLISLKEEYDDRVVAGYDRINDNYLELNDNYKIIVFANPYKTLVHPYHHVEYFLGKDVLPIYINYGYAVVDFWKEVINTDFYNYMWKVAIENEENLKYLKKTQKIKGANASLTGYIKMDRMFSLSAKKTIRKKVLICPHHTVWGWDKLNISNFIKYASLFLDLPKRFPEIDFIFRPHPLLFENLVKHQIWSENDVEKYLQTLLTNRNVMYERNGDYLQTFLDSDAMIHDCASFIAEYLYTENPCCYMLKDRKEKFTGLIPLGKECIKQHYFAYEEEDIIRFIQDVVLAGFDTMKDKRRLFAEQKIMINYPQASQMLLNIVKKELGICEKMQNA